MRLSTKYCQQIREGISIGRALYALEIPLPMYFFGTRHNDLVRRSVARTYSAECLRNQ